MEAYQFVLQGGAIAVLLLGFGALLTGRLRTSQELEQCERRAVRAEAEADKERARSDAMIPAIQALTATVSKLTDELSDMNGLIGGRPVGMP